MIRDGACTSMVSGNLIGGDTCGPGFPLRHIYDTRCYPYRDLPVFIVSFPSVFFRYKFASLIR